MTRAVATRFSTRWFRGGLRVFAFAACTLGIGLAAAGTASAQTSTYTAPDGFFDVQVPAGWTTEWDSQLNQVTLRRGSAMATVQVLPLPKETSAFATEMLATTKKEFFGQCKGAEELQHGQAHIAGMPAQSFLLRCLDAPPSVAGTAIAWSDRKIMITYTVIAQIRTYGDDVATLDAIGNSIHPTGLPAAAAHAASEFTEDERVDQVSRACRAGSFTQTDCAVRLAHAHAGLVPQPAATTAAGPRFHDADSVFSVEVPAGWQASLKDKNGIRGVELRRGESWIAVMIAPDTAKSASDVVLNFEAGFARDGGPKPPLGKLGIIQLFGQGMEVDYDTFPSKNDNGADVQSMVAGVAADSGSGPRVLMFSSIGGTSDATGLRVARSIRLGR